MTRQLLTERSAAVLAVAGLLVFVALGAAVAWLVEAQIRDGERDAQSEIAAAHGQLVLDQLGRANASTTALAAAIGGAEAADAARFNHAASTIFGGIGGVSALAWAPGGTVRAIYPAGAQKALLGAELPTHKTLGGLTKRAIAARRTIISGPVNDTAGRPGLIAIAPIRHPGARDGVEFRGFALARVELDSFLKATRLNRLPDRGHAYELSETFAEQGHVTVVARSHEEALQEPVEVRIDSAVTHWVLRVAARHEAYAFALHWAFGIVLLLGMLVGRVLHAHLLQMVTLRNEFQGRRRAEEGLRDARRQLKSARDELGRRAGQDGLTGLGGRAWFSKWMESHWLEAARDSRQMSIAVFDIDNFGAYNAERGHAGGDACLRQVAAVLAEQAGDGDAVARMDGDSFVVAIDGGDAASARALAERSVRAVSDLGITHIPGDGSRPLTVSAGVATIQPEATMAPGDTLRAAHEALDRARGQGGNRFVAIVLAPRGRRTTGPRRPAADSSGA